MKILLKLSIILVILSAFCLPVLAYERTQEYFDSFEEILPEGFSGITQDTEKLTSQIGLGNLISEIGSLLSENGGRIIAFLLTLIGGAVLLAVSASVPGGGAGICECCVGAIVTLAVFSQLYGVFASCEKGTEDMIKFFSSAIPVFTAISVAHGATATASVQAVGMNFTVSLFGGAGICSMLSITALGLSLSLLSFLKNDGVSALSKSIGGFFKWSVGIATAVIMAFLSLQSVVSSAADSAAMRAAKYAASGMIPIVGNTVSGALSTLSAGLTYAKDIIGAGAVAVIVSIVLAPLVMMILYRAALSASISFSSFVGSGCAVRIYSSLQSALDSIIAVYSLCSCICIFEIILFMKSGVSML